jgi:type I restriction enzyme S subunit
MGDIPKISVALPPLREQVEIVQHLKAIQANYVSLTRMAKEATNTLLERRSALVEAAVTGKIDVWGQN